MALFDKKTTETNIPELQEYYANQKRESTGLAWLLALGSLLITAAVIIGLFIGGRWAYRKISNKNKTTVATVETTDATSATTSTPSTSATTTTPAPTTTPATTTPAQGVATTQSTTTNTNAVAATTTVSTTAGKEVPNTGPGNTIGLFVAVTVLAYFAHNKHTAKKLSR